LDPVLLTPQWTGPTRTVVLLAVAWLAFAVGVWLVMRLPRRTAVVLIVAGGVLLPLSAGVGPPRSSDDLYRYVWDGRVQAAGIDPYRHVPAAAELAGLRDPFLWPQRSNWCVAADVPDPDGTGALVPGCTLINRPTVPTIYPPVAEALFAAVQVVSPPSSRYGPIRLTAIGFAAATTILLLAALRSLGGDVRRAVLWAWCPTVAIEAGSNAHIDVAAVFLAAAALWVLSRAGTRRAAGFGGLLLGLAVACKITPALVIPALLRRRPATVLLASAGAVVAVYVPHVVAAGPAVLGYLPGYLSEEGFISGSRFALLTWLMPKSWAAVAAVVILGVVAALVARTADPDRPWLGAATVTGAALLLAAPTYPWYALLLVVLVGFGARVEWLAIAAAGYLAQYARDLNIDVPLALRVGYGVALATVLIGWRARHGHPRRGALSAAVAGSRSAVG
jgi:hypothetical protein